jgi:hypothetical protein
MLIIISGVYTLHFSPVRIFGKRNIFMTTAISYLKYRHLSENLYFFAGYEARLFDKTLDGQRTDRSPSF